MILPEISCVHRFTCLRMHSIIFAMSFCITRHFSTGHSSLRKHPNLRKQKMSRLTPPRCASIIDLPCQVRKADIYLERNVCISTQERASSIAMFWLSATVGRGDRHCSTPVWRLSSETTLATFCLTPSSISPKLTFHVCWLNDVTKDMVVPQCDTASVHLVRAERNLNHQLLLESITIRDRDYNL